jgi:hypothetical protein
MPQALTPAGLRRLERDIVRKRAKLTFILDRNAWEKMGRANEVGKQDSVALGEKQARLRGPALAPPLKMSSPTRHG